MYTEGLQIQNDNIAGTSRQVYQFQLDSIIKSVGGLSMRDCVHVYVFEPASISVCNSEDSRSRLSGVRALITSRSLDNWLPLSLPDEKDAATVYEQPHTTHILNDHDLQVTSSLEECSSGP